jgi:hypothetical protein
MRVRPVLRAAAADLACAVGISMAIVVGCAGPRRTVTGGTPPTVVVVRTDPQMSDRSVRAWSVIEAQADSLDGAPMRDLGWTCTVTMARDGRPALDVFELAASPEDVRQSRARYSEDDAASTSDWHTFRLVRRYTPAERP